MFKLDLEKAEEPEIKLPTSVGSSKKARKLKKKNKKKKTKKTTPTSALLTMQKPLCGSRQNVENSERDGNTRLPYLPPEKICM